MSRIERRNREIERRQWAHTERQRTELRLKGYGEGYIQELFFGKAFSSPPEFSYSAVFDQVEQPVLTNFITSPRGSLSTGLDQYGMGNDSQSHQSTLIYDPGFESQGKYWVFDSAAAATIPGTGLAFANEYGFYEDWVNEEDYWLPLKHVWETPYVNDWALRYTPGDHSYDMWGPHRWLQTEETHSRWSVTQSDHHDLMVGEEGKCSATAEIGPNGYTNWLIPINWNVSGGDFHLEANGSQHVTTNQADSWRLAMSVREPMNQEGAGEFLWGSVPPPHIRGFRGIAHAKAGSAATLEFSAMLSVLWLRNEILTLENTAVMSASDFPWVDQETSYNGQGFPYRELWEYREEYPIPAGGWSGIPIEVSQPEGRSWPGHPDLLRTAGRPAGFSEPAEGGGDDYMWWTFRYRIKGTPGTTVYLDNIFMDWDWRNEEIAQLTIGVDEWIVDEAGAYIGARLWVVHGPSYGYYRGVPGE